VSADRNLLVVPESCGEVFAATSSNERSILWCRNDRNVVRNVVIENPTALVATATQPGPPDNFPPPSWMPCGEPQPRSAPAPEPEPKKGSGSKKKTR